MLCMLLLLLLLLQTAVSTDDVHAAALSH